MELGSFIPNSAAVKRRPSVGAVAGTITGCSATREILEPMRECIIRGRGRANFGHGTDELHEQSVCAANGATCGRDAGRDARHAHLHGDNTALSARRSANRRDGHSKTGTIYKHRVVSSFGRSVYYAMGRYGTWRFSRVSGLTAGSVTGTETGRRGTQGGWGIRRTSQRPR